MTVKIDWTNKNLKAAQAAAAKIAKAGVSATAIVSGTNDDTFAMLKGFSLALHDGALGKEDTYEAFKAAIAKARVDAKQESLAENRLSERWSIVQLGTFDCAEDFWRNVEKVGGNKGNKYPSPTSLFDIAYCARAKGAWAQPTEKKPGGQFAKKPAFKLDKTGDAPSVNAIKAAISQGVTARTKRAEENAVPLTHEESVANWLKLAKKWQGDHKIKVDGKDKAVKADSSHQLVALVRACEDFIRSKRVTLATSNGKRAARA
jgi:hypothetical protein